LQYVIDILQLAFEKVYWPLVVPPPVVPPALEAPVVPLVLPLPVPVDTGPLLIVPPLVVLPVVPEVELPPVAPVPSPVLAALSVLIESISVLDVPLMSELPLASESVATSPDPVLDSDALPLPPQEPSESVAPKRATARKLMRDLYIVERRNSE
jgi:hypothetical protein